jgi:N-acetylneuraminic acid mutarotase
MNLRIPGLLAVAAAGIAGLIGSAQALHAQGTWSTEAPMPTARSSLQGAAANGLLYAVGGLNNGHDTPIVEAYNPVSNSWSTVSPLNAPNYGGDTGRYLGSAIGVNGKVYMMGGWTNSPPLPSNTLSIYDPSTDVWSAGPAIPGSGFTGCSEAAVIGSNIYLLNACNGYSGFSQQLSIFDTNTNSWTTGPNAPRNHNAGLGAALNGKFYVTGGTDGSYEPQVDVYDPATNTWTTVGSMPVNLWSMAGDVIDGKWYIVGGSDPTTNYENTVWIYDPAANTWTSGPTAPTARCCAAAATIDGKLYVVGGADSTGNLSTLEVFNPAPTFAGTPGLSNCHGQSVAALAHQYGGINAAAAALGYPSVKALQTAIGTFCRV